MTTILPKNCHDKMTTSGCQRCDKVVKSSSKGCQRGVIILDYFHIMSDFLPDSYQNKMTQGRYSLFKGCHEVVMRLS